MHADEDAKKWIKIFTFLSKDEIEDLIKQHDENAAQRLLQKTLAKEITLFVHSEDGLKQALETTEKLFANQSAPAENLSEEDLENMEGIVKINYELFKLNAGIDVITFLAETNIFPSKGEARKMIQNGGVSINRKKIDRFYYFILICILHEKYLLVQKGKKNYYLMKAN